VNRGQLAKNGFYFVVLFFSFFLSPSLWGTEYVNGRVRLVLHENGRFNLYYIPNFATRKQFSLWSDKDPKSSFLEVYVGNQTHRLGDSRQFVTRVSTETENPSFMFGGFDLRINQDFRFLRTVGSSTVNGIEVTFTMENLRSQAVDVGLRMLLDTELGEVRNLPPFLKSNGTPITAEYTIPARSTENYWVSRNDNASLMGSVVPPGGVSPQKIVFANWKRLKDALWETPYTEGRSFSMPPYSVNDSAVCYYYAKVTMQPHEKRTVTLLLSAYDANGFGNAVIYRTLQRDIFTEWVYGKYVPGKNKADDVRLLQGLMERMDQYQNQQLYMPEDEILTMNSLIAEIKTRYGIL
jgi:hypothetical protein